MPTLTRFVLRNKNGMQVELCDFGARIMSIKVPSRHGSVIETTLNHETDDAIIADDSYMGATVGRTSNRIANSQFTLDDLIYKVSANEGENNLHGGEVGFSKRIWTTQGVNKSGNALVFALRSNDGDQGFPGEVNAEVHFTLNDQNELRFDFKATTDKPTPINFCNHAYFTMGEESIHNLELSIQGDAYLPVNEQSIPLGHFERVENTRFDFNRPANIGTQLAHGIYDHCYRASKQRMATLTSQQHQLRLEVESDHVGIQFYSGNFLPTPQSALCLEAQGYPDAINHPALEHDILRPGEVYSKYVIYRYTNID